MDFDTVLDTRITNGAAARAAADTTEANARAAADTMETNARTTADTALGMRIDDEATARAAADTMETNARTAVDTALGTRIDAEATARATADTVETNARTAADTVLGVRIDDEATARVAADTMLQENIYSLDRKVDKLEQNLSTGIALSLAMQAPTVSPGKKLNLSIGAGTYNGETAAAFSFGARVNERLSINGGIGFGTSRNDFGARIGASIEF